MNNPENSIPEEQTAVQLIGRDRLEINTRKKVHRPGPTQILAKVEAVGLCFSDLKLLRQFDQHPRKGAVISGLDPDVLDSIPSYVPGDTPTVPGHEVSCRIIAVGSDVQRHQPGERCIVQTDYRTLVTSVSTSAFGYNFEGGLQEYILMDERVIIDPITNERFLIPVGEDLSAAAVCLGEPWACVEDSYQNTERQTIKPGGQLLVIAESGHTVEGITDAISADGPPASLTAICTEDTQRQALQSLAKNIQQTTAISDLPDKHFDDIIYFGANPETIAAVDHKLGMGGIANIVTAGNRIGQPVSISVGRVHYELTRWIGTRGSNAAESYQRIPARCEMRDGDRVIIIGAGGPMGQMHVIRTLCLDKKDISVVAADLDNARLDGLLNKARPIADAHNIPLRTINPSGEPLSESFSYHVLMAPVGRLVADAIQHSDAANAAQCVMINIFAGIPVSVQQELDLDRYIDNRCFMFGTSGSTIEDMKIVLKKTISRQIDTNASVDAVCGMAGVISGFVAMENQTLAGKTIVYPELKNMDLIPLSELADFYPTVAEKLDNGTWCKAAEDELRAVANSS